MEFLIMTAPPEDETLCVVPEMTVAGAPGVPI
jgi:hypothetical protein